MKPPHRRIPSLILLVLLLALFGGVGALDYITGYELRMGALYAVIVGFATWNFGLPGGIAVGLAAVGIEQWAELAGGKVFDQPWVPYANSASRLTIYLFVAFSFSYFRRTIDRARSQLQAFQGRMPVCTCCNRVDGGDGFWMDFPNYVRKNSDVAPEFTICPLCAEEGQELLAADGKGSK